MLKLGKTIATVVLGLGCVAGAGAQTIEEIEKMIGVERMGELSFNLDRMTTYSYVTDDFTHYIYYFYTNSVGGYANFYDTPVMTQNHRATKNFSFTLKEEEFKGFSEEFGDMDGADLSATVIFSAYFYSPYFYSKEGFDWSLEALELGFEVYGYNGDGSRDLVGSHSEFRSIDFTSEYLIVDGYFTFSADFRYPYYLLQAYVNPSNGYWYTWGDDFFVQGGVQVDVGGAQLFYVSSPTIPEPETWAMLLAGLGIVGAVARRRKVNVN
ncbi:MAG: PEPxxWA-CTERM sorting domain-containing protein [Betaproteobacteria bacterium]|nr:PEPxxWA-CTERM sorting domain-containing protein [Betaproteobacteria bacterium]